MNGWVEAKLGDLFSFKNGMNAEKSAYGNGIPFVNVMDVFGTDVLTSDIVRGKIQASENQIKEYLVKRGDVLFNRTSETFDEIALATVYMDDAPIVFGGFVIRARPRTSKLDPNFCVYFFQADAMRREMIRRGQGAVRANIGQKDLATVPAAVPPLAEQKRIAEILSTWDRAIERTEKLIANSEAQRDTLTQQLLTGKMRLKRFTQSELVRHNKLGPVPSDWKIATIEHVASEVSQRNDGKADYPVLSCSKYDGFVRSLDYFKKQVFSADTSNYKMVKRNQFGFPSNHVEEGSIGLQNIVDFGLVSPIYCVFEPRANMRPFFLYKLLKTDRYRQLFASATNASVDRRGSLRWGEFSQLPIAIPTLEEQEAIGKAIRTAENHVSALSSDLEKLKHEKSALMYQLLTGKRRVRVDEEREAAVA